MIVHSACPTSRKVTFRDCIAEVVDCVIIVEFDVVEEDTMDEVFIVKVFDVAVIDIGVCLQPIDIIVEVTSRSVIMIFKNFI